MSSAMKRWKRCILSRFVQVHPSIWKETSKLGRILSATKSRQSMIAIFAQSLRYIGGKFLNATSAIVVRVRTGLAVGRAIRGKFTFEYARHRSLFAKIAALTPKAG